MGQQVYDDIDTLVASLKHICGDNDGCVVSIDGFDGCGKTSLARQLVARIEMEHIELDSFLTKNQGGYVSYLRYEELADALRAVMNSRKAILVEGVCVQSVLKRLKIVPTVRLYVKRLIANCYWSDGDILRAAVTAEQALKHEQESLHECAAMLGQQSPDAGSISGLHKELIEYHFSFQPHETAEYIFQWRSD